MAPTRDYYDVLGVTKGASLDEIKRAFRKIALASHPDRNPGDAEAEARFKEATEAYAVLSDDEKRLSSLMISVFMTPSRVWWRVWWCQRWSRCLLFDLELGLNADGEVRICWWGLCFPFACCLVECEREGERKKKINDDDDDEQRSRTN